MSTKKYITNEEFDDKFDNGGDISEHLDVKNASKRVLVEMPLWMIDELDKESQRRGISRQPLIKNILVEFLDHLLEKKRA